MKRVEISKSAFGRYVVGYNCPYCRERLKSALKNAGKPEACPSCHRQLVVPGEQQLAELQKPQVEEPEIIAAIEVPEPGSRRSPPMPGKDNGFPHLQQEPPILATFSPEQDGFQDPLGPHASARLSQQPLYSSPPQTPQSKSSQQAAIAGCFVFTFGFMLLMCGCPLIVLTGITSGTSGVSSSYSSSSGRSSYSSSSPSYSSSYSSPSSYSSSSSPTIDDIDYEAYRREMEARGHDPDMQSESSVRALNKALRDAGW